MAEFTRWIFNTHIICMIDRSRPPLHLDSGQLATGVRLPHQQRYSHRVLVRGRERLRTVGAVTVPWEVSRGEWRCQTSHPWSLQASWTVAAMNPDLYNGSHIAGNGGGLECPTWHFLTHASGLRGRLLIYSIVPSVHQSVSQKVTLLFC